MDGTKTANEFARKDGILRVRCVGHAVGRHPKSDAFIITLNDRVWLIDGGMRGNYDAYERLLDLREAWIGKKSSGVDDETCKLHITCLISHFHVDHVQELVSHILKSPYIAVDEIVFPPETALRPEASRNEDYYYRNVIRETLAEYQPYTKISVLRYGLSGAVHTEYDGLTLDMLPPDSDWGTAFRRECRWTFDFNQEHQFQQCVASFPLWRQEAAFHGRQQQKRCGTL